MFAFSLLERVQNGFRSKTDLAVFVVVVGAAVAFLAYLVGDGLYHRMKWRRLRRKFKEASGAAAKAEQAPGTTE